MGFPFDFFKDKKQGSAFDLDEEEELLDELPAFESPARQDATEDPKVAEHEEHENILRVKVAGVTPPEKSHVSEGGLKKNNNKKLYHDDSFRTRSPNYASEVELKQFSSEDQYHHRLRVEEDDDGSLSTEREPNGEDAMIEVNNMLYAHTKLSKPNLRKSVSGEEDQKFLHAANDNGNHLYIEDEIEKEMPHSRPPADAHDVSYWLFFIQGIGMLFPWNAFINAGPYFKDKLATTSYAEFIENDFELTFQISHLCVLMLSVRYQHLFTTFSRTIYPLYTQGSIFSILMIMVFFKGNNAFFWITVVLSFFAGGATSVFQSGMFGLAGMLPFKYTQAIMAGQSAGAVIIALFYIIFLEIMPNNNASGLAFFAMAVAFIFICLFTCYILQRRPIVIHYMKASLRDKQLDSDGKAAAPNFKAILRGIGIFNAPFLLSSVAITYAVTLAVFPGLADAIRGSDGWYTGPDCDKCNCWDVHSQWCDCLDVRTTVEQAECFSSIDFTKSVDTDCFASRSFKNDTCTDSDEKLHFDPWVFFINSTDPSDTDLTNAVANDVTMTCLEDSCCESICSQIDELEDDACKDCEAGSLWVPVCVFLLFNVGEIFGRTLVGKIQLIPVNRLALASLLRVVFLPLFMLCRYKTTYMPSPFSNDAFPIIFMLLFAITNGITGSLAMMYGPEQVEPKDRETAGSMMVTALTVGLNSGSFLSYALKAAVTHESPF